jgi:hypothetical protein
MRELTLLFGATMLIMACDESREMADLLKIMPKIAEF